MTDMLERRRSIRLANYDYSQAGAYFITVCTFNRQLLFGEIADSMMLQNKLGEAVAATWSAIPEHFPHTLLDAFVVMPNHVHGVIVIPVGAQHAAPSSRFAVPSGSLAAIVRSFKSAATKRINDFRGTPGEPVWQRNYYEHVVRTEENLDRTREYIVGNPALWEKDDLNPRARAQRAAPLR